MKTNIKERKELMMVWTQLSVSRQVPEEHGIEPSGIFKGGKFIVQLSDHFLFKNDCPLT
jgi:hypothetical protein